MTGDHQYYDEEEGYYFYNDQRFVQGYDGRSSPNNDRSDGSPNGSFYGSPRNDSFFDLENESFEYLHASGSNESQGLFPDIKTKERNHANEVTNIYAGNLSESVKLPPVDDSLKELREKLIMNDYK